MTVKRKLIGSGAVSKIYLEDGFAYKTFKADYPLDWLKYEAQLQNEIAENTQLLVPKTTVIEATKEIKMDYIAGCTLTERMRKEKYKMALADLVDLQLSIQEYHDLNLPQAHQVFAQRLKESKLDENLKANAQAILQQIEVKNNLCHFDFHFLNILYSEGQYYIIDWVDSKLGNPILDIARTYVIFKQHAQRLANKYLKLIVAKGNFEMAEVQAAIPLMATLRLLEGDAAEFKEQLLEMIAFFSEGES
ncbi:thiamine kinase-like enzyme [Enterococcus sp. PF1-24]|uniref:phosphotransferase n=1 Tax=unclassified Enterococcus TaxID=2608891 RepID=UPI002476D3C2|nr:MULTISPECIES: phosphotransferase [unclassified Enterococcus]MDH6365690.1 thiamine kinase-like enzyme [Enterococcus sp. PFB1-1]MDH6402784.1 thiamine kinase-like enzyme [Enterococcus sp. PF1-24]